MRERYEINKEKIIIIIGSKSFFSSSKRNPEKGFSNFGRLGYFGGL